MSRIIRCTQQDDLWLTLVRVLDEKTSEGRKLALYRCVCGKEAVKQMRLVDSRVTRSCGCMRKSNGITHGMKGSSTYSSWQAMLTRCRNENSKDYPRWGAKGVKVCERWLDFSNFAADMGERPDGTSLDRFPNRHGNYEPGNCRWATAFAQQHNKDNFVVISTPLGTMPLIEYAPKIGISVGAAHMRLKRGKLEGCIRADN